MANGSAFGHLQGLLPDNIQTLLHEHVLRSDAPLQLLARIFADQVSRGADAARPYLKPYFDTASVRLESGMSAMTPLLDRAARAAYDAPDMVLLGVVLLLLILILQILSMVRRIVAWWTRLAFRVVFWSCVALLVAAVWQRGLERSVKDTAVLAGQLVGYGTFVRDVWQSEYQRYQQQQVQAQAFAHGQAYRMPSSGGADRSRWAAGR